MLKSVFIIGGDMRFISVANMFCSDGYKVYVYGIAKTAMFDRRICFPKALSEKMVECDAVILPLPATKDKITIFAPLWQNEIYIDECFEIMKNKTVFCGKVSSDFKKTAEKYGILIKDYFDSEYLNILNCIPTAEGAIGLAVENTPFTLFGAKVAVLGFGRVGRYLSKVLCSLGAKVTVEARKEADLAWIEALGYTPLPLSLLEDKISQFDIIFNTVPQRILKNDYLEKLKKEAIIIDLASSPFGADLDFCRERRIKYIIASSLPGKVAPQFAGKIIKETISSMFLGEGEKNEA